MQQRLKTITLLDATLREGEQALGICFSLDEKIALASTLKDFGVSLIEIGHPGVSETETEVCKAICEQVPGVDFLVHARACEADILAAIQSKAQWVGIWASYNEISLAAKFSGKSREWIKTQVQDAISLAKKSHLNVRFTIEDASRTELHWIHELGLAAVNAGADRISLADTVGAWHPQHCHEVVKYAVENFFAEIEVHLHNDLGLAHANAISAIEAGASVIDVSVLGIGERAGICDLFAMSTALEKFYGISHYHFPLAAELSRMLTKVGAFTCAPHHPIVGKNVFTHVSPYHIKAVEKHPEAYEFLNPETYGAQRKSVLNTLARSHQKRFSNALQVKQPFKKGASELRYHRDGVGQRWVFMDNRVDSRSAVYVIERIFDQDYSDTYQPHVDPHTHHCDSFFVFMGNHSDGSGLEVEVTFISEGVKTSKVFESPASIVIPAGVAHTYAYVKGIGRFLNFVLSPNYNESLLV